jgi:hypothetical protein
MKKRNLIPLAGAAVLLSACIPSVNPFYFDKDVVFDARLLGEWQEKGKTNEPEIWKFEKTDDKAYKLTVTEEEGKHGEFSAHLFSLKQEHFLDIIPTDFEFPTNQADLVSCSMFPGHLLVHLPQLEPELKIELFNFDWLAKYLEKNPTALAHRKERDSFLLTAKTRDLQRFVMSHLGNGELFEKKGELVRKTGSVSAESPQIRK